ncbi:IPT/TIG domain-containing protein [Bacteroidota bacterium]
MKTCVKILIILFLLLIQISGQDMWHDYGLSNSAYNFGRNKSVEVLKSIIVNDSIDSPLGHYSYAVEYLFYENDGDESQFLIENLNTEIDETLPYPEGFSQWQKYYSDAYILGLLGQNDAILKMETIANSSPDLILKRVAIARLAEAGLYNHYEFIKDYYTNHADEGNLFNGIYEFSLYGRDSRYTNEVRNILESKAREQTKFIDIVKYSYIGNFDSSLYIGILNEHFENSQGKERYDTFFQLGIEDFDGQPERTIFALQNEENDSLRAEYLPFPSSIFERDMYSKLYLEPKFINSLLEQNNLSTTSSTYLMKKLFLDEFKPNPPDSTTPPSEMIDSLIRYSDQCNSFGWLAGAETYNDISAMLQDIQTNIQNENWFDAYKGITDYMLYVEDAYDEGGITEDGYKFLWYYGGYLEEPLDALAPDVLPGPSIVSTSPTITVTKTKDFVLTVYGDNFSKKTDVFWKGKKKKTKFISKNIIEVKIKKKDVKKDGTYIVTVGNKKSSQSEGVEFNVYKDLPGELIPVLNCVEELDKKKYAAWFGYENYNDGIVYLEGKENEIKGGKKTKGKGKGKDGEEYESIPPVIFMPGIHEKVFSVEFDKKKITWELLKEKAEATEDSPPCVD